MTASDSTPTKTCTKCGECKSIFGFGKGRGQCNECRVKLNREMRLRNDSVRANAERKSAIAAARQHGAKPCKECCLARPLTEFRKKGEHSYDACCKECRRAIARKHYAANKDAYAASGKQYRNRHSEVIRAKKAEYVSKNRQATTKRQAAWAMERRQRDEVFALKCRIRSMLGDCFRNGGYTKNARAAEILGCDWVFLMAHIERQFDKGMAWAKMGSEIHIDHIVPLATAKTEEDVIRLNHFTNLRPMWAEDNLSKGAKVLTLL